MYLLHVIQKNLPHVQNVNVSKHRCDSVSVLVWVGAHYCVCVADVYRTAY